MDKKNSKYTILIIVLVLVFVGAYYLINYFKNKNQSGENGIYLKNYAVNEYIPTYVSDEKMAKIYLNDYMDTIVFDTQTAYELLDEEYKKIKFPNYNSFYNYVVNMGNYNVSLKAFTKKELGDITIFEVYDNNDNYYAFKTQGVLQYTVFLDKDTVEIW